MLLVSIMVFISVGFGDISSEVKMGLSSVFF